MKRGPTFLFLGLVIFCTTPHLAAKAEVMIPTPAMFLEVQSFDDLGRMHISQSPSNDFHAKTPEAFTTGPRDVARIWGVLANPERASEALIGKRLGCDRIAEVGTKARIKGKIHWVQSDVLRCRLADQGPDFGRDVSEFLVAIGAAREFCAESLGTLGSC
ncbi:MULTISPECIES: hypothetical protein [Actibacterium]|uniref:Uncharacterized protein n=1 Tax=Actibacterium naphthalenivorans TaxID=1614693 RepID=A0A840CEI5_9RHOB|nr:MULTISPECIES: hypothetical protein [Actibacterium]ALG92491.1 hypothetical protein TQ29_20015 [Actibacterium sp. EMB200-NS6]MBB4023755.1 hypothetical protein [Actibacterium naphthalenivorans]